jgi:biopolymer transport protein ExbD
MIGGGAVRWNDEVLPDRAALEAKVSEVAAERPPPSFRITANKKIDYQDLIYLLKILGAHNLGTGLGLVTKSLRNDSSEEPDDHD